MRKGSRFRDRKCVFHSELPIWLGIWPDVVLTDGSVAGGLGLQ